MRKTLVLVVVSLLMSVIFASTAYAYQSRGVIVYGNGQSGSVSFGDHGYSWYHADTYNENEASALASWRYYLDKEGNRYYYHKQDSRFIGWGSDRYHKWVSDRNSAYYYVDDNGVKHYFYLDPDREYEVYSYKDKNGITQYAFVKKEWKLR